MEDTFIEVPNGTYGFKLSDVEAYELNERSYKFLDRVDNVITLELTGGRYITIQPEDGEGEDNEDISLWFRELKKLLNVKIL